MKLLPQWSPGLMAGGRPAPRLVSHGAANSPQWSPGLMAGGSGRSDAEIEHEVIAAMEPRPDGRGKSLPQNRNQPNERCRNGAPA